MEDLFEHYEELPQNVQDLLIERGEVCGYAECEKLLADLKPLGYTFEYGLDSCPVNLTKIEVNVNRDMFEVICGNLAKDLFSEIVSKAEEHGILHIGNELTDGQVIQEARVWFNQFVTDKYKKEL